MTRKPAKPKSTCTNRNHEPTGATTLEVGTFYHTCPACGDISVFTISRQDLDRLTSSVYRR